MTQFVDKGMCSLNRLNSTEVLFDQFRKDLLKRNILKSMASAVTMVIPVYEMYTKYFVPHSNF